MTRQKTTDTDKARLDAVAAIQTQQTEKRGRKMGRPSKYDKARTTDEVAGMLAQHGLTDAEMAAELGVSERTYYRWRQAHPEFRQSIGTGKELPDSRVEASLFRRAIGFTYKEDGKHKVALPDVTAARFWLTNRRPDRWREAKAVEVNGSLSRDLIDQIQTTLCDAVRATLQPEDGDRLMRYLQEKFDHTRG
ncbi:MAG: helix-turn-helix domain-containing protein [Candidatus Bipolaricaulis sp.]|nr:helix-turn-helix domain-containing protein [Candidatus Bipolaricaulis sp.]